MKRKHMISVMVLFLFVFAAACGQKENVQESQPEKAEETEEAVEELPAPDETAESEEELAVQKLVLTEGELLNRNYYNKELCYWNGSVYCLREGGLYRRAEDETEWELLCELSLTPQKSMEIYDHWLYFMIPADESDAEDIRAPKILCRYDLENQTLENLMELTKETVDITIYNSVLYLKIAGLSSSCRYEGWKLNESGVPETELEESSPEFVCRMANEYQKEEEENSENVNWIPKLPNEVIASPDCALLLDGNMLFSEPYDEAGREIFLYSSDGSRKESLFTTADIFMVTEDGIYYIKEGVKIYYYSFSDQTEESFAVLDEWTSLEPLTYDEEYLYGYDMEWKVLRISRDGGEIEYLEKYQFQEIPWCCFVDNGTLYME